MPNPSKLRQGMEWWCVVSCATVSVLGIAASAQTLLPPSSPQRQPLFTLVASSSTTASIDQSHARHVSPIVTTWQMRVDSTVAGVLFARQPSDINGRYYTDDAGDPKLAEFATADVLNASEPPHAVPKRQRLGVGIAE